MAPKIVVVGSFNADLMAYTERLPRPGETVAGRSFALGAGGKGTNQAVAAARLGAQVAFVGRIGQDVFAQSALELWRREGIDASRVVQDPDVSTGVAPVLVDDRGENSIVVVLGANLAMTAADADEACELIASSDVVLTQLEIAEEATRRALEIAREAGVKSVLNPAPATSVRRETLELADWLTPNETELQTLRDSIGEALPLRDGQKLAVTLGAAGAALISAGDRLEVAAPEVDAVDTTGAGDAFNGALAVALAEGAEPVEALRFANAAAALSVTRRGTSASMATRAEVDAALSG